MGRRLLWGMAVLAASAAAGSTPADVMCQVATGSCYKDTYSFSYELPSHVRPDGSIASCRQTTIITSITCSNGDSWSWEATSGCRVYAT